MSEQSAPDLREQWLKHRQRLAERGLLASANGSLSLRRPGANAMWFGRTMDPEPRQVAWAGAAPLGEPAGTHAAIYRLRGDVGAITAGGGFFGVRLADFGGAMPQVFDEQARYLGPMGDAVHDADGLAQALRRGGNAVLVRGTPFCLGATGARMAHNAELFEKCATAYVLATAAGGKVTPLLWLVRWIANGRLGKERRAAALRFAAGLLPEESRGY